MQPIDTMATQPKAPAVHVTDCPVGVVGEGVDGLDRHHRAFEGGHAVEGQGDHQEASRSGQWRSLCQAPERVMMPLIMPPQLGANRITDITIPTD